MLNPSFFLGAHNKQRNFLTQLIFLECQIVARSHL